MEALMTVLLVILILNAVMVVLAKDMMTACVIFMAQSLVMVIVWILLESPDLAITEAAVGAGVSSLLFFLALKNIRDAGEGEKNEGSTGSGD